VAHIRYHTLSNVFTIRDQRQHQEAQLQNKNDSISEERLCLEPRDDEYRVGHDYGITRSQESMEIGLVVQYFKVFEDVTKYYLK
jgi:hypothetical protein